ncbi:hypothetical protein QR680_004386 [Steinernema hermaphroditum]|uniref:Membrane-associated tyrosine- and threonine-specific cdc2-inhibitory kinase wee-1.3 n=1 Tax=Steinernema hermaphroditum TaxID=289476 RepID=A0AA39HNK0_9BILA|nr:hypothetical protein QR680_004386 [Steinernema hermaphroditum]
MAMDLCTPRPTPVFYDQFESPLSTKREKLKRTPARNAVSMPRLAKTCPAMGRLRSRLSELRTRRPVFITFDGAKDNVLSQSRFYDPASSDTFFDQCFTVIRKLGEGSFGEVFCVRSKDDSNYYAIKRTIEPYRSLNDRGLKRREVEKLQTVGKHPNLVHFIRAWEEQGLLYIQTELCERSLDQLVADSPTYTVPEEVLWRYFHDLLQAVNYLHSRDLIHVDIKPANIFVTRSGVCQLGDFGLMMDLNKDKMANADEGDSKYLAFEVLNGKPSKPSDIFSLGISILELASGLFLPSNGVGWEMLRNHNIPPEFLRGLSEELVSIITAMMDPDPEARPTASELLKHPRFRMLHLEKEVYLLALGVE